MVERESDTDLTDMLKAAADPTRRTILTLLAQQASLKVLEKARLVSRRTEWREHLIELSPGRLSLIDQWFKDLRSIWELRLDTLETLVTKDETDD